MKDFKNENCICLTSEVKNAQLKKDHTQVCHICGKTFIGYGNNPYPIAKDGLCCDDCNEVVVCMRLWLDSNHDWLKDSVDKLLRNRIIANHSYICGKSVAYTFYKDDLTKSLDVVVACDDECFEKVVEETLQNWVTNNYSNMNLEKVLAQTKTKMKEITNNVKILFEPERVSSEESVITSTVNEIFERLKKVFDNTVFQVDIDTSTEVSIIAITSNYGEYIQILIDDPFVYVTGYDVDDVCSEEKFLWSPECDDVDVFYEKIKDAVITVYASIAECRMSEMFNEE